MLPKTLRASIDFGTWDIPPVFKWLKTAGNVAPSEMVRTFNAGVGMVIAVDAAQADSVTQKLSASGEKVFKLGRLVKRAEGAEGCVVEGLDAWKD